MGRPETFGVTHHIGRTGLAWISGCKTAASDGSEGRPRFPVSNNGLLMGVVCGTPISTEIDGTMMALSL